MSDFLYQYRLQGDATIHRIRAPESMEQEAIHKALEMKHGRTVDLLMLKGTATVADAEIPSLSERETGSATTSDDAIAQSWRAAFAKGSAEPRDKTAASWPAAFRKAQEG